MIILDQDLVRCHVIMVSGVLREVVCTDLSVKEPCKQVGVDRVIASENLDRLMVRMLDRNGKKCQFESCSRSNISYIHHPDYTGAMTRILYKVCAVLMMNLPYLCTHKRIVYVCIFASIK